MRHPDEGTIHAWLDGALPSAEASALEAHVAGCAECAAAVAEARGMIAGASRILTALDAVPGGVVPGSRDARGPAFGAATDRAHAAAGARAAEQRRWRGHDWWRSSTLRAAAAVLLFAGGSYLVLSGQSAGDSSSAPRHAYLEVPGAVVMYAEEAEQMVATVPPSVTPAPPAVIPAPASPAPASPRDVASRGEELGMAAARSANAGAAPRATADAAEAGTLSGRGRIARQAAAADQSAGREAAAPAAAPARALQGVVAGGGVVAPERDSARGFEAAATRLSEIVVTGAGAAARTDAPQSGAVLRLEERLRPIDKTAAAPASVPEGCYRFDRPLGPSAVGELERGNAAWHDVWLGSGGSVERPYLRDASRRDAYLGSSYWYQAGDTVLVRVFDGRVGWSLVLLPDGEDYAGIATYLSDAPVVGREMVRLVVRAVRMGCPAPPAR